MTETTACYYAARFDPKQKQKKKNAKETKIEGWIDQEYIPRNHREEREAPFILDVGEISMADPTIQYLQPHILITRFPVRILHMHVYDHFINTCSNKILNKFKAASHTYIMLNY